MRKSKFIFGACAVLAAATLLPAQYAPPALTKGVGLDQNLNAQIPLDDTFRNESNQLVPLRTYFGDKPAVLALVYYRCPGICDVTLESMASTLRHVSLTPGKDYNVVIASINPAETPSDAVAKKKKVAEEFNRSGFDAGWHFLTGSQESISRLASAVGFRYRWDPRSKQFIHAAGIMIATPEGKISRYFYGVQYTYPDVRLGLIEASNHKIGSPVDYFVLYCCPYDPATGRYTLAIVNVLKIAGGLTILGLGALLFYLMRGDPNKKKKHQVWKEVKHAG